MEGTTRHWQESKTFRKNLTKTKEQSGIFRQIQQNWTKRKHQKEFVLKEGKPKINETAAHTFFQGCLFVLF